MHFNRYEVATQKINRIQPKPHVNPEIQPQVQPYSPNWIVTQKLQPKFNLIPNQPNESQSNFDYNPINQPQVQSNPYPTWVAIVLAG